MSSDLFHTPTSKALLNNGNLSRQAGFAAWSTARALSSLDYPPCPAEAFMSSYVSTSSKTGLRRKAICPLLRLVVQRLTLLHHAQASV